jgi:hypothetical protein
MKHLRAGQSPPEQIQSKQFVACAHFPSLRISYVNAICASGGLFFEQKKVRA